MKSMKQLQQEQAEEQAKIESQIMAQVLTGADSPYSFIEDKEQMWQQAQDKIAALLGQMPTYEVPRVIKNLKGSLYKYAKDIKRMYGKSADELLKVVEDYGDRAIAKQESVETQFAGAQEDVLDIYRSLTKSDYGQKILEDKLGAETAGQISRLKEYGMGSGAALSEVAKLYSGQQSSLRDLAVEVQGYKTQAARNLAEAQERSNAALATIQQNTANILQQQQQVRGSAVSTAAGMKGAGIESAAQMMTTGATTLAAEQEKAYQSDLAKTATQLGYYSDYSAQMNPYVSDYMQRAQDKVSIELGYQAAAQQNWNNYMQSNAQTTSAFMQLLGAIIGGGAGASAGNYAANAINRNQQGG